MRDPERFWEIADHVKRRLFHRLRLETQRIEYVHYSKYQKGLDEIPKLLINEWVRIRKEFQRNPNFLPKRLKGYMFEVLFYYASLRRQAVFIDAELAEMGALILRPIRPGSRLRHYTTLWRRYTTPKRKAGENAGHRRPEPISW